MRFGDLSRSVAQVQDQVGAPPGLLSLLMGHFFDERGRAVHPDTAQYLHLFWVSGAQLYLDTQ